jgi:hypothetical protein
MRNRSRWVYSILLCMSVLYGPFNYTSSASVLVSSHSSGLHVVGSWNSKYTYRLDSLNACSVGDANLAFVNEGNEPVSIVHMVGILPKMVRARVSIELIRFRRGQTTGELSPSFDLAEMASGRVMTTHEMMSISPYQITHAWYFIVLRIRVTSPVPGAWVVRGAKVEYKIAHSIKTLVLRQTLILPPQPHC